MRCEKFAVTKNISARGAASRDDDCRPFHHRRQAGDDRRRHDRPRHERGGGCQRIEQVVDPWNIIGEDFRDRCDGPISWVNRASGGSDPMSFFGPNYTIDYIVNFAFQFAKKQLIVEYNT